MQNNIVRKKIILGLGSNLNAIEHLRQALLEIRSLKDIKILKVSRIYESKAQLLESSPLEWNIDYLNAAILIEIKKNNPTKLLVDLKNIEKKIGRKDSPKWSPREIDIDILYAEDFTFESTELSIPHKMFFTRDFAYLPAREVYPQLPIAKFDRARARISEKYFWPEFVGILNVTPDSFSDGGSFFSKEGILKQARNLISEGAVYLDIGAESTRPGAKSIIIEEEINRLKLAFECLNELKLEKLNFKISLDSRNFETIKWAVENFKIDLINDVSGLSDERILKIISDHNLKAVCMHSLTVPANKEVVLKNDSDVIQELLNWWSEKEKLFSNNNIFFDPGFGFGKTTEQNNAIFNNLDQLAEIQNSFFLGYSRKSFLNEKTDVETAKATGKLNLAYAQFLRVHNIKIQRQALGLYNDLY